MTDGYAMSLLSQLDRRSLPHRCIEVEVTESVFAEDTRTAIRELEILQTAGIRIALDDFGTGFSSLNMLRELPLDVVKIDRSFITELETSDQARILMQHLISIATTLGKEVVAEGVETEVQLQHLKDANCHYVQGYLVSKAKPADEFLALVNDWQRGSNTASRQQLKPTISSLRRAAGTPTARLIARWASSSQRAPDAVRQSESTPSSARLRCSSCSRISSARTSAGVPPAAIARPSRRPMPTALAPRHSAFRTSAPRRNPPSTTTGTRPSTASTTSGRASMQARV